MGQVGGRSGGSRPDSYPPPPLSRKGKGHVLRQIPGGLASIEAAYQTLGRADQRPRPAAGRNGAAKEGRPAGPKKGPGAARSLGCRNYIKYPAPQGLRPRAFTPFRVADLCKAYNFPTGLAGGGRIGILELGGGYRQSDLDMFSQLNGLPQIVPDRRARGWGEQQPRRRGRRRGPAGHPGGGGGVLLLHRPGPRRSRCSSPERRPLVRGRDGRGGVVRVRRPVDQLGQGRGRLGPGRDRPGRGGGPGGGRGRLRALRRLRGQQLGRRDRPANVDMPSACPHIIGCGGTRKTPFSEVVWGDGTPNGRGTGGGYSAHFPPQDFQVAAPASPGQPGRMVPDVAADADPDTGYLIVVNGQEIQIGGTSAVAPLYSGLFAAFGQKLGFVTPTLYQNPQAFADVTEGSNGSLRRGARPRSLHGARGPRRRGGLAALFAGMAHAQRRPAPGGRVVVNNFR